MTAAPEILVFPDANALFRAAAGAFAREAASAIRARGSCTVALSGGTTPAGLYERLAADAAFRDAVDWTRVHVFWGDERHVPPDHPDSNYGAARGCLLSKVPVPPDQVHRIRGEDPDPDRAAAEYEEALRTVFRLSPGEWPRFDCALLGLGADGHTASLFPESGALDERVRLVVSTRASGSSARRITLTPPVFNHAACVLFLVIGEDKAEALRAVLEGSDDGRRLPARLIRPASGRLVFLADARAARRLGGAPTA